MSTGDLLIASICINRNEELLTHDKDFLNIQKVDKRFKIRLYKVTSASILNKNLRKILKNICFTTRLFLEVSL